MLRITKIFQFEAAHAIEGYDGPCKNIHGHSYELHVSVAATELHGEYIPPPGFIVDFKELKRIVSSTVINALDHKVILSRCFIEKNLEVSSQENLVSLDVEPTAENLLIFIRRILESLLPAGLELAALKLYETKTSYAEWINRKI